MAMQPVFNREEVQGIIKQIGEDIHNGYRFLPFVGAGLSLASGYPIIRQLEDGYLPYCVLRALRINPFVEQPTIDIARPAWMPRSGVWPDMGTETAAEWEQSSNRHLVRKENVEKLLSLLRQQWDTHNPYLTELRRILSYALVERACASLGSWREMLTFLSQVVVPVEHKRQLGKTRAVLALPDDAVIDCFFRHLALGRNASLAHRMLQALSSILRFDVILSTNFDDFIERAFEAVRLPLAVFEVPVPAPLPPAELVLSQRSLVKMHGGRFAVRANASIDMAPDGRDAENFLGYLAGRKLRYGEAFGGKKIDEKVAVLVTGCSGSDQRTFYLLQLAFQWFPRLHIYWLASGGNPNALVALRRQFDRHNCFYGIGHPNHGLLLLEIFQRIKHGIPTAGVIFPGIWESPVPPIVGPTSKAVASSFSVVVEKVRELFKQEWHMTQRKPILFLLSGGFRGGVAVNSSIFLNTAALRELGAEKPTKLTPRPVWIDLDEVWKPVGMFLRVTLLAAKINGEPDPISALDIELFEGNEEEYQSFCDTVINALRVNFANTSQGAERLAVFVNVQEGCGIDSSFASPMTDLEEVLVASPAKSNSDPGREWRNERQVRRMLDLAEKVNADDSCGVQFLFIARTQVSAQMALLSTARCRIRVLEDLIAKNTELLLKEIMERGRSKKWEVLSIPEQCSCFDPETIVTDTLNKWLVAGKHTFLKIPFLYSLTLFRHARYPACLERIMCEYHVRFPSSSLPECAIGTIQDLVNEWLKQLEQRAVVRFKSGGFVWMHPTLKITLRLALEELWRDKRGIKYQLEAFHIESLIARWYGRLVLASGDPLAAVESIYHSLHAMRFVGVSPGDSEMTLAAQAAGRHANQVLNLAGPLFQRRLADRFADQALANLHSRLILLLDRLKVRFQDNSVFDPLLETLIELLSQLIDVRGDLYIAEGEYKRILEGSRTDRGLSKKWIECHLHKDENLTFRRQLRRAAARVSLRYLKEADFRLAQLWSRVLPQKEKCYRNLEDVLEMNAKSDGAQVARIWLSDRKRNQANEFLERSVGRLARQSLHFQMQRAQIDYLFDAVSSGDRAMRERRREEVHAKAMWFYHFGAEVLRHANFVADGSVWEESVRLRSHAALCHVHIRSGNASDASTVAYAERILADAEAYIDEFPLRDGGLVRVIAQMRRAEIKLLKAGLDAQFRKFRSSLFTFGICNSCIGHLATFGEGMPLTTIQKLAADIRDALGHLESAEVELRHHPKARWWWWGLVTLKSKAMEYLYTCRLARFSVDEVRSSPLLLPSAVDLFRGGIRSIIQNKQMIDPLFLSRVLESFNRTTLGHVIYHVRRNSPLLSQRVSSARSTLLFLKSRLETVRTEVEGMDIDPAVKQYRQACLQNCNHILGILSQ